MATAWAWEYDCVIYNGVTDQARVLGNTILRWTKVWQCFSQERGPRGWKMAGVNQTGEYSLTFVFKRRRFPGRAPAPRELPRPCAAE